MIQLCIMLLYSRDVQAVARHSRDYCGIELDWQTQTLLTNGATEALAAAFLGFLNPGDEV